MVLHRLTVSVDGVVTTSTAGAVGAVGAVGGPGSSAGACPPRRSRDRFGRPGGEHDLAAACAERVGDLLTSVLDRDPGGHALLMDASRIAGEGAVCARVDRGSHRRGGGGSQR